MRQSVDRLFERRLSAIVNSGEPRLLAGGRRGLERESLRVGPDGRLSQSAHPRAFGSALTNPHITTDYSESLLELVTPTFQSNAALMAYLEDLHRFVYARLGEELLWAGSMPGELGGEEQIPIAFYGSSHQGRVKSIYRHGLLVRYGGLMQAISGVHFNYSLPPDFWALYADVCRSREAGQPFISARYFDLLRNYRRYGWLVLYLFGASPALCRSFLQESSSAGADAARGAGEANLSLHDPHTLVGPQATSLRMSDLGYRNRSLSAVRISVNSLEHYLADLRRAVHQPHPPYIALGVKVDGEYRQLSGNLLQIENEYYSSIRPKRTLLPGERTAHALARAGVEYVEVRALDNSIFDPVGVHLRKLHFLEAFLQMLLLKDSPPIEEAEEQAIDRNHLRVARRGRESGLALERDGRAEPLATWAEELLEGMEGLCELLDGDDPERPYRATLAEQRAKILERERTPSARVLARLSDSGESFPALALGLSRAHRDELLGAAWHDPARESALLEQAEESLAEQARLEARQRGSFDAYLAGYLAD